jgi:AcrR family transcriptional regulator
MSAEMIGSGGQLPRGRHRLTRGAVVENQRRRLIRSVPAAVAAKGYPALTVEDICTRAGVSRRTFYENFRDKEDCFITSMRQHAEELASVVAGAASAGADWPERARLGLAALLRFLSDRPDVAHMAVIDVMSAGPAALSERDRAVTMLASLIGDEAFAGPNPAPRLVLRTVAGSILSLIYGHVRSGRAGELDDLLPTIMYVVLVAWQGPAAAARSAGMIPVTTPTGAA